MLTFDQEFAGMDPPSDVLIGSEPRVVGPSKNWIVSDWFPAVPPWIQNSSLVGAVIVRGVRRLKTTAVHGDVVTASARVPTLTGLVDAGLFGAHDQLLASTNASA